MITHVYNATCEESNPTQWSIDVGADHFGVATDQFGLRDRTALPRHKEFSLAAAGLLKRGYTEEASAIIVGGSFMRLFKEVSGGSQP